jgi:proton glutamate symport protein
MDERPGFRFTLTHQILLGLVVGCVIGATSPEAGAALKPVSALFLRLIKMIVAPLLFTTLVAGVAGAGKKVVGRIGLKALAWFLAATSVALTIGMITANLARPGDGIALKLDTVAPDKLARTKGVFDFILDAIPTSILDALARNDALQIVVFSVFLGLAIGAAGKKAEPLKQLAEAGAEAMFKLVGYVMRVAPFGVGAAIAVTLSSNGLGVILPLLKCVVALYAALIVFFVLLFTALRLLTRAHLPTFLRAIREPALIAFTTSSSEAALPRAMQVLEQLGVPRRVVGFVVPTGYAFNLDGSTLYLSLAFLFITQAAGMDLPLGDQLTAMAFLLLSSKGVAGVPRAAIVVLASALPTFHLPEAGIAILLGIDALMDMGRTCVNVVGNCVATVVVAAWDKQLPADAPVLGPRAVTLPAASVVEPAAD